MSLSAAADYKDSYSRGLEAAKDGDWAAVRQRMQEAIADNPTAAQRVRLYGQRWEPYVPQFYLGLAAFKQGDCAAALSQWRSPANAGVIGSVPNLKAEQDRSSASCESRLAQQGKTDPGKTEPGKTEPAKTGGTTAPDGDRPVRPEPPKPEPPKPEPRPEQVKPKPEPPKPEPPRPVETPLAQRVPAPLLEAFRNYLGGRYADVLKLNPDNFSEPRARAQALLIRAAARQIQGELDGSGADAARADIRAVRALNPTLTPDPALFSPRFRSLYNATR